MGLAHLSLTLLGFTERVTGADLLARMTGKHAATVPPLSPERWPRWSDAQKRHSTRHRKVGSLSAQYFARHGREDEQPSLPDLEHAVKRGLLRYCAVCDGFEAIDRHVAVMGYGASGLAEALFLRAYTPHITLLTLGAADAAYPGRANAAR